MLPLLSPLKRFLFLALLATSCVLLLPKTVFAAGEFITTWQTSSPGESITIPTNGGGYSYDVDWGDSSSSTGLTGNATHSYTTTGTHTVMISGTFPQIYFANTGDKTKIQSVEQWGTNHWASMDRAFYGASNLVVNATDTPDLSGVSSMAFMFAGATHFNQNINNWDVSHVVNMVNLFFNARTFNQPLNSWNMSSVTNINFMFLNAWAFNQPLSSWDVSHVPTLESVFSSARSFNQDISNWDVSHVHTMMHTFQGATAFNQPLNAWDVSHVSFMWGMFQNATSFNQPLGSWNVGSVINMDQMFSGATSFNQPLNSWNVSNAGTMWALFDGATSFNQPLNSWNVSNVESMRSMFQDATAFNQDLSSWDVSQVTDMPNMFSGATSFNQPLNSWNVSNSTSISGMFAGASNFNQPLDQWNVSNVTDMGGVFSGATAFNQPLNTWDVSHVTSMNGMFADDAAFNQPLDAWNTGSVEDMGYLFAGATSFNRPLSTWNVSHVTSLYNAFTSSTSFDQDLGAWDISNVTDMTQMFANDALSILNYDSLLGGWSSRTLQPNVIFDGGNSQYLNSAEQRASIISTYNWTITDGGLAPTAPPPPPVAHGGGGGTTPVKPVAMTEPGSSIASLQVRVNGSIAPVVQSSQKTVQLSFNADPYKVNGYTISLKPDFPQASIYRYAPVVPYSLPDAYGEYTIYVKFYSITGDQSDVITRTISYAPAESVKPSPTPVAPMPEKQALFRKNFGRGANSEDVRRLQQFLNAHGFAIAPQGDGSFGKETTLFGAKTVAALKKYQNKNGITPASGFFGPSTLKLINLAIAAS